MGSLGVERTGWSIKSKKVSIRMIYKDVSVWKTFPIDSTSEGSRPKIGKSNI